MSFADLYRRRTEPLEFEHATVHQWLTSGPGAETNTALPPVTQRIAAGLDWADRRLRNGLANSRGRWQGRGADLVAGSTPLSRAIRALRTVSEDIERRVVRQAKLFGEVRAMPRPRRVEPIELGGSDTPPSFLDAQFDKEFQERAATAAEETARRQYERYRADMGSDTGPSKPGVPVPSPRAR